MKKLYFILLSAALLAFTGCNKDIPADGPSGGDSTEAGADGYVWMDMTLQLPVSASSRATRSSTDWEDEDKDSTDSANPGDTPSDAAPDSEEGWDYENTVKTVLLVLAGPNDEYISHVEATGLLKSDDDDQYEVTAKFKRADIDAAYDSNVITSGGKQVKVYAYANYTNRLHQLFNGIQDSDKTNKTWLNWAGEVVEEPSRAGVSPGISNTIWAKHSFLMTNSRICTFDFPAAKGDWDAYTDESTPYSVTESGGLIYVERAAARIDFKDDSGDETPANTYNIIGGIASPGGTLNLIDVQLTRMSLVNMSKNFYYLRRVADDYEDSQKTDGSGGVRIGKNETSKNWVVDTDWKEKKTTLTTSNAGTYFNFPLYQKTGSDATSFPYNNSGWYTDNIKDIVGEGTTSESDNWGDKSYKIWRYVTENTLPGEADQKTVQSTGVVFKGLILPGKDIDATVNTGEDSPRYISEKVEEALYASKYHLPKKGDGNENTSNQTPWTGLTAPHGDHTNVGLTDESKESMSYDYPTLYEFDGLLYAGFDEVVARAELDGEGGLLYEATQYILNHWALEGKVFKHKGELAETDTKLTIRIYNEIRNSAEHVGEDTDYTDGYSIELDESDAATFKTYATSFSSAGAGNFTLYEASYEDVKTEKGEGWGYYCYYFYWNRHNDNGKDGKMGRMEFAVVRNNVYKLSVEEIRKLGHPRNPDNDPDPYEPGDPDEEESVYLKVKVEVLPWVVRVNKIKF